MEPKHILIKHRFRQRPLGRMDDEDIEFLHRKLVRGLTSRLMYSIENGYR